MSLAKLQYYDHPEGQDAFGKMIATNRYALTVGLVASSYDVLMYTKPSGYAASLGRFAYVTGPMLGMASAFTMTTLVATKMRGKCDTWNYIAGAIASGSVFGAWQRCHVKGCLAALVFTGAAILKKNSIDEGWQFFPEVKQHGMGSYASARKFDFTMTAERPRGWTNVAE